jgi:hypothetical protein
MKYFAAVCQTVFVFSLLAWAYVVVFQMTYPEWLSAPMTHYDVFPFNVRVDDAGIISFVLAAVGFLLWRSEKERGASSN